MLFYHYTISLACLGVCVLFFVAMTVGCHQTKPQIGTVIILNGPSAAGKSSIIKAFQAQQKELWLAMGIDSLFVGVLPSKIYLEDKPEHHAIMKGVASVDEQGKLFTLYVGEQGYKIIQGMHRSIAAYARAGNNVIVDYIMYDHAWLKDMQQALQGIQVINVGITASLPVLEEREKKRATSPQGHARSLHTSVHEGWTYDLEINNDHLSPDQVAQIISNYYESQKAMNNKTEQKSGAFIAQDKEGSSVQLEWRETSLVAPDFASTMKAMWRFARDAYLPVEMNFLKTHPEVVGKEAYFKPFEPLFKEGSDHVNWQAAEEVMESILKKHFLFDAAEFPEEMKKKIALDRCFVVMVQDNDTGKELGFITFLKRASYKPGDIKVMSFAVDTAYQGRGFGRLLMSSLFKIDPSVKRIFLSTRVTNQSALRAYSSWGFVQDKKPVIEHQFNQDHWTFMEYVVQAKDTLQQTAQMLR